MRSASPRHVSFVTLCLALLATAAACDGTSTTSDEPTTHPDEPRQDAADSLDGGFDEDGAADPCANEPDSAHLVTARLTTGRINGSLVLGYEDNIGLLIPEGEGDPPAPVHALDGLGP